MAGIGATVALIKALTPKADPAVIQQAVEDYLEAHPEISVADGSITEAKLAADVENAIQGKAPIIIDSVKGNPVAFSDGLNSPLENMIISFEPYQSGSGDPSPQNDRAIYGLTGFTINHSGADTSDPTAYVDDWTDEAGIVYGGVRNFITGSMLVKYAALTLNTSDMNSRYPDSSPGWESSGIKQIIGAGINDYLPTGTLINKAKRASAVTTGNKDSLYLPKSVNGLTESEWKALNTNITFVVPLATPIEIQLTPIQITAIAGEINNIWSDENVKIEVEYLADTKKYVEKSVSKDSPYNPLYAIRNVPQYISCFEYVGCIGDSLMSGAAAHNSSGSIGYLDQEWFSWPQFLARATGNTYYKWSQGGLTTKTWLTSEYATECFDGEHKAEAYIIGLGANDRLNVSLGSSADIDMADYTQNADTYYGNYAQIIQHIQVIQPKAKIFVITNPIAEAEEAKYNDAVRYMATAFENVYVVDLYKFGLPYINSGILQECNRRGHYNAIGYKFISQMIATYIDWIIEHNLDDFLQIEFISKSVSWNDT